MSDPVVIETNRYHSLLEQEARREETAEAQAMRKIREMEFGREAYEAIFCSFRPGHEKALSKAISLGDHAEAGRLLAKLLLEHLTDEILDND